MLLSSVLTFAATQRSARVTLSFNLTLLAATGRMSSTVRDFTFLLPICNLETDRGTDQGTNPGEM